MYALVISFEISYFDVSILKTLKRFVYYVSICMDLLKQVKVKRRKLYNPLLTWRRQQDINYGCFARGEYFSSQYLC